MVIKFLNHKQKIVFIIEILGIFIDNEESIKGNININIVLPSLFNYSSFTLITGGHVSLIHYYDLKPLYDFMSMSNDIKKEERIL